MLPSVSQSTLDVQPIDWSGLPTAYMDVNEGELEALVALVRSVNPKRMIEIGVNVGRTAKAILANVPGIEHYTGIDVPLSYVPSLELQRNNAVPNPGEMVLDDPRFHLVIKPKGSLDCTKEDLGPCDVVFIDGDHGYAAVVSDSVLARQIVRTGGLIVWHDYHDEACRAGRVDVKAVLDELHRAGAALQLIENTWLVFERR